MCFGATFLELFGSAHITGFGSEIPVWKRFFAPGLVRLLFSNFLVFFLFESYSFRSMLLRDCSVERTRWTDSLPKR